MATITTAERVDDPVVPVLRSRGLLTDVADPVTSPRWQAGVRFVGYDATNKPVVIDNDWCAADSLAARTAPASQIPTFETFSIWDGETCSTLGVEGPEWLTARTNHRVALWTSFNLAKELMTGAVTSNPSLQSTASTVPGGTRSPKSALLHLELQWGISFGNQRADIHMHPALMIEYGAFLQKVETSTEVLAEDGSSIETETVTAYFTPSGHRVVFDAGYGLIAPGGGAAASNVAWIYASGPVGFNVAPIEDNAVAGSIGYARNEFNMRSHTTGLVVFDPDTVLAQAVGLTDAVIDV